MALLCSTYHSLSCIHFTRWTGSSTLFSIAWSSFLVLEQFHLDPRRRVDQYPIPSLACCIYDRLNGRFVGKNWIKKGAAAQCPVSIQRHFVQFIRSKIKSPDVPPWENIFSGRQKRPARCGYGGGGGCDDDDDVTLMIEMLRALYRCTTSSQPSSRRNPQKDFMCSRHSVF